MVIAFEGLPGAGKTTAARRVAGILGAEPLTETTANHPFLNQVYDDSNRDDLTVELAFLIVHANPYRRIRRSEVTVADFSPAKDQLFAEDMLDGVELSFFEEAYKVVYTGHKLPDLVIYPRAEPELCLQRIHKRLEADPRRQFEAGVTLERLERMQRRYEKALARLGDKTLVYDIADGASERTVAEALATMLRSHIPN